MTPQRVALIDRNRTVIATAQVAEQAGKLAGSVDLSAMPADALRKFEEYEEIVLGQMFSLLDDIETEIMNLALRVVWPDGHEAFTDLQIYPSTGRVSFQVPANPVNGQSATSNHPMPVNGPVGEISEMSQQPPSGRFAT